MKKNIFIKSCIAGILLSSVAITNIMFNEARAVINFDNKNFQSYSYKTFVLPLTNKTYLEVYTKGDGFRSYFSIEEILHAHVVSEEFVFGGNIYLNLENNYNIYYNLDGNLYTKTFQKKDYVKNTPKEKLINYFTFPESEQKVHLAKSGYM